MGHKIKKQCLRALQEKITQQLVILRLQERVFDAVNCPNIYIPNPTQTDWGGGGVTYPLRKDIGFIELGHDKIMGHEETTQHCVILGLVIMIR